MEAVSLEPARRTALRPWLLISLTAPFVVAGLAFLAYRWQSEKQDSVRLSDHFIQRQNEVLAHDAQRVGQALVDRLSQAARDARVMATLQLNSKSLVQYFQAIQPQRPYGKNPRAFPIYNRLAVLHDNGSMVYLQDGRVLSSISKLEDCLVKDLCDSVTLERARKIPVGKSIVGKGLRWYVPQAEKDGPVDNGTLSVAYRGEKAVYLLGIDFRTLLELLRLPTFPYRERANLLQEYEDGNYIYLLDSDANLLAHPKPWHMMGVDRGTGKDMLPMKTDADAGSHPLNFRAYRQGKLRPYFDRLFERSFKGSEVDVFQAANLSGMIRVISVAPVHLDPEVFEQNGVFGYVGVGCALEHFQEPEERLVPYY